jgi:cytochrome c biogenesis protein
MAIGNPVSFWDNGRFLLDEQRNTNINTVPQINKAGGCDHFIFNRSQLVGIFLPQIPLKTAASPDVYGMWMENVASGRLGDIAYFLEPLGFFQIFRSGWFVGAVAALMLNILTCMLLRGKALRKECQETRIVRDPVFYGEGTYRFTRETPLSVHRQEELVRRVLAGRHYALTKEEGRGTVSLAGDRHRYACLGTIPLHLSLILLLAGVLVGMLGGFQDDSLVVVEGAAAEIGHGTGLSIYLLSIIDDYWEDGTPRDYRSSVGLYEDGDKVKSGVIRVNHPMSYAGVRIHQGFFGPAVRLLISDAEGNPMLKDHVALADVRISDSLQRPAGRAIFRKTATTSLFWAAL